MSNVLSMNKNNISKAMSEMSDVVEFILISKITAMCPDILNGIYEDSRLWMDDLGNLSDSFAWAVFYNGSLFSKGFLREPQAIHPKVVKGTFRQVGTHEVLTPNDEIRGRDAADEFISAYKPDPKYKFQIVFVAGMYYATFQEEMGRLGGFINAKNNIASKVKYLFKSTRKFYYSPARMN
jgi:hypothetical protein